MSFDKTILTQERQFPDGGFADVFFLQTENRVIKLFKSHKHPGVPPERGTYEDDLRRLAFKSENEAYRIITNHNKLKHFIPQFLGNPQLTQVRSLDGADVTERYLLDCCLHLEMIDGTAQKFSTVQNRFKELENELHAVGVRHTSDMSAFLINSPPEIKLIDFAVSNAYTETETQWIIDGKIE